MNLLYLFYFLGELVPAPLDPDRCLPVESFVPFTHQQQRQNETQQQQQGVLLPQQQPVMVQPEQLPQEHQQPVIKQSLSLIFSFSWLRMPAINRVYLHWL